jgi:hypothetical protein
MLFSHIMLMNNKKGLFMETNCSHSNSIPYKLNEDLACFVAAMAYVPWQYFTNVYEPCKGLRRGTIFPELDKPFEGRCVR